MKEKEREEQREKEREKERELKRAEDPEWDYERDIRYFERFKMKPKKDSEFMGWFFKGKYRDYYGNPIKCTIGGGNKCIGSVTASTANGGTVEISYGKGGRNEALKMRDEIDNDTTEVNYRQSGS